MKQGWTYKKLGEVCNIDYGTRVVRSKDAGSIYPVYGGGGATFKMDTYNREDSMVISRFGMSEQCTRFVKGKFFLNDSGLTLSMKEPCMIQAFMDWEVFSLNNIIYSLGRGAAQKNLDTKALAEIILSYPNSLSEQQRIVERLDSAFAHIDELKANAEKQVNEARALFQKALSKAMEPKEGWAYKKLGEVCEVINGLWKGKKAPFINVGVIRNANFTKDFSLRYDNIEFLDVEQRQYSKRKLLKGDLIVEKSGGSEKQPVGRAVLFDKDEGEFSFSNFTSVLRIKKDIDLTSKFLYIYLLYIYKRGDTASMQKATTGIHNIEFEKYLNIDIPYISLSEQQRIVSRLDSLSKNVKALEENQRKVMAECDALKQALLRKVFE